MTCSFRLPPARIIILTSFLGLINDHLCHAEETAKPPGVDAPQVTVQPPPKGITASDWSSIRAAHQASRHAIKKMEDGSATARNPGQQWNTQFDGRGFLTIPDVGCWQWGLELQAYGSTDHEHALETSPKLTTTGNRLVYAWDSALEEWFVNDSRGLEHGFTVRERPQGGTGGLQFTLKVRGPLRPEVAADGLGVSFVQPDGGTVLTYAGLKVWDADGQSLRSRFEPAAEGLMRLTVFAENARYPVTIDPIAQQAYIKAGNTDADDGFGDSVAISGDTLVVGATYEDGSGQGVNPAYNNSFRDAGAAYVFVRVNGAWTQQAYLKSPKSDWYDNFGVRVAISGDTIVVTATGEDGSSTGVNPPFNNLAVEAGAAYVYTRKNGVWSFDAYLKAANTGAGDQFGVSAAISGNTIVIGALYEDGGGTGVNPASDELATDAGAAYVFVRTGSTWSQQAYLKASNTGDHDHFGLSCAVDGDTIVIGSVDEDGGGTGANPPSDEGISDSGAAYVFVRNGTTWTQQAYLKSSNPGSNDSFGNAVAVSGDTLFVGAQLEDGSGTGLNPNSNNNAVDAGAAYIFNRTGTTWTQQAYLKASNTGGGDDRFGRRIALDGDVAVIGAHLEDGSGVGVNPGSNDVLGDAGAAYVFVRTGLTWSQKAYLKASNPGYQDNFGWNVAVSGGTVVVGSMYEDGSGSGVNPVSNENASNSGAAYIFTGFGFPKIVVEQPANSDIANGGSRDFGNLTVAETKSLIFTLKNTGTNDLTDLITSLTGSEADDFAVTADPGDPVSPSGSTTFTVRFIPGGAGVRNAVLHIASNDATKNPFDVNLTGTGTVPDIAVEQPAGIDLTSGSGSIDYGTVLSGANTSRTFAVKNSGVGNLTGLTANIDDTNAGDFTFTSNPVAAIAPGGSSSFTIKFTPSGAGTRTAVLHIHSNDPDESSFNLNLTGLCIAPEIVVEQPLGTPLTDGGSAVPFDDLLTGNVEYLVFTIKNEGDGNLNGLTITNSGTHANQFLVSASPATPVLPAGSTTFTVRFSPTSAGVKNTTLHIASNDFDETPFDINLTGLGVTPILPVVKTLAPLPESITHEAATLRGTVDALGHDRHVTFLVGTTTAYGTELDAEPADLNGTGATDVSLHITGLLPHTAYNFNAKAAGFYGNATGGNVTFTTLDRAPVCAGPKTYHILPNTTATLTVLSGDMDPDGDPLSIAALPVLNPKTAGKLAKAGTALVFTPTSGFTGDATFSYTASDGFGMTGTADVTLTVGGSCTVDPEPLLFDSAADTKGITITTTPANSVWTVSESVPWLSVSSTSGTGDGGFSVTVLPNASTKSRDGFFTVAGVSHKVTQAGAVERPTITVPNPIPPAIVGDFYSLVIPTTAAPVTYKVTNLPPGLKMDNSTGTISGIPTKALLTPEGEAKPYSLNVTASNAFGAALNSIGFDITVQPIPAGAVGVFHGLIERDADLNDGLGSRFELTTTALGACSGKIITGATTLPFKGKLQTYPNSPNAPTLILAIPRKGKSTLTLDLLLAADDDSLTGTIEDDESHSADLTAWHNAWSKGNPANDYKSLHTLSLEQPDTDPGLPQGSGYGSFSVKDTTGGLTLSGKLADGSAFATATFLGKGGQILIYQSLYTNKGSLTGVLKLATDNTLGPASGGIPTWLKPANIKETNYPDGFGPIPLTAEGATYTPPEKGEIVMGLDPPVDNNNAKLSFSSGGIAPGFDVLLGLTTKANVPANANLVHLTTITAATGLFAGDFTVAGHPKVKFQGQIVTHGATPQGYGFFLLPESTAKTALKLSGKVLLSAP